jgi:hypothetical protein
MYPKIFKMVETEYTVKIPERKRMCVRVCVMYDVRCVMCLMCGSRDVWSRKGVWMRGRT